MSGSTTMQVAATAIAHQIEKYWLVRGYQVKTEVIKSDQVMKDGFHYFVRSDLVNGFPKDMPRTLDAVWALRGVDTPKRESAA